MDFYWIPVLEVLKQLLCDESIATKLHFKYQEQKTRSGERVFGHFISCNWMKQGRNHQPSRYAHDDIAIATEICQKRNVLPLIFGIGSDATNVVKWGSRTFHPVYIWLPQYLDDQHQAAKVHRFQACTTDLCA